MIRRVKSGRVFIMGIGYQFDRMYDMSNTNEKSGANEVMAFLNGKAFILDGVNGTFKHSCYVDRHGLTVNRLDHNPSAAGKRSEAYQQVKRQLHDDWSTDLTQSIETYCKIATDLGFR